MTLRRDLLDLGKSSKQLAPWEKPNPNPKRDDNREEEDGVFSNGLANWWFQIEALFAFPLGK
jgi:hypothetical protein